MLAGAHLPCAGKPGHDRQPLLGPLPVPAREAREGAEQAEAGVTRDRVRRKLRERPLLHVRAGARGCDEVPGFRGDLVGELGLIDGYARSAALVAVEASHFFVIPAAVFERLRQNSAFERRLLGRIAAMLREGEPG